ncbi:hypothetical protein [Cohnella sp.]|uniref:hypothetical protein n=1 Tax=Cohnella sp. TaxID=1883426 RepID=UPI003563800C
MMGKQRIRRKRRRGFRKPDAVIVTLTSVTVILLFVWGGLHWKESSGRALFVNANGAERGEQTLQEEGGLQAMDSEGMNAGVDEQSSATAETFAPVQQPNDKPDATGGVPQLPESDEPAQDTVTKMDEVEQSPVNSESPSATETNHSSTNQTDPASTNQTDPASTNQTDPPSTNQIDPPSTNQTDPPISQAQKYEQKIIQVQASCTKDMNEVLSGAESSIQQLDRTDPVAVQAWKEKLTKELADAESKCDGKFQEVSQNAEKNSVSPKVIEEWKQTFSTLKEKLQIESRAKLQQLMGG